jgi:kynureninase
MHDMTAITERAHAAGALVIWDLAHSAGAVPVDLHAADADFAIGCGYKYLNGGPGAPGFVWVHPRHANKALQPLSGWWGHAAPFAFTPGYEPAPGILRYQCGSQPILSLIALDEGVSTVLAAESVGGMQALRAKSLALTDLFINRVDQLAGDHGLGIATPRVHSARGSQVSLTRREGAYQIVQALIARGVVGDFRAGNGSAAPDILRFGFTPLYLGFADVWRAAEHLQQVTERAEWREPRFEARRAVT